MARTVAIGKQDFEKLTREDIFYVDKNVFAFEGKKVPIGPDS